MVIWVQNMKVGSALRASGFSKRLLEFYNFQTKFGTGYTACTPVLGWTAGSVGKNS